MRKTPTQFKRLFFLPTTFPFKYYTVTYSFIQKTGNKYNTMAVRSLLLSLNNKLFHTTGCYTDKCSTVLVSYNIHRPFLGISTRALLNTPKNMMMCIRINKIIRCVWFIHIPYHLCRLIINASNMNSKKLGCVTHTCNFKYPLDYVVLLYITYAEIQYIWTSVTRTCQVFRERM